MSKIEELTMVPMLDRAEAAAAIELIADGDVHGEIGWIERGEERKPHKLFVVTDRQLIELTQEADAGHVQAHRFEDLIDATLTLAAASALRSVTPGAPHVNPSFALRAMKLQLAFSSGDVVLDGELIESYVDWQVLESEPSLRMLLKIVELAAAQCALRIDWKRV